MRKREAGTIPTGVGTGCIVDPTSGKAGGMTSQPYSACSLGLRGFLGFRGIVAFAVDRGNTCCPRRRYVESCPRWCTECFTVNSRYIHRRAIGTPPRKSSTFTAVPRVKPAARNSWPNDRQPLRNSAECAPSPADGIGLKSNAPAATARKESLLCRGRNVPGSSSAVFARGSGR